MKCAIFLLSFFSNVFINLVYGQPGTLDISFDSDGKLTTAIGIGNDVVRGITVQPDGKIVAAGFASNGLNSDFALARYNADGTLDNTFSIDGKLTTAIGSSDDICYAICLQPDGKIIAAGYSSNGLNNDFALVRYNVDGSLDNSFDGDGIVITPFDSSDDIIYSMIIQTDGKIIVVGCAINGTDLDFALARYNVDGSLDISFGNDGKVLTDFSMFDDKIFGITLQTDGKIVVVGYMDSGTSLDWALARYNVDGSLDSSFDMDGKQSIYFGISYDVAYSLAIQPDGKIITGGCTYTGVDDDFSLARFNVDGSLDNTFDGDGKVVTSLGADDWIFSLLLQVDGKSIVAGYSGSGPASDFALARYNTNGSLDSTFGTDGIVLTDYGTNGDMAYAALIQSDLKIIAAGYSNNGTDNDFALARYLSGLNLGLVDFSSPFSIFVYPNPISNKSIVEYFLANQEEISIELMDMNGCLIEIFVDHQQQDQGLHKQLITFPECLAPGSYYLIISSTKGKIAVKVFHTN